MGSGEVLFTQAPDFNLALLGRAITGLGAGFVLIGNLKIAANWFSPTEFATLVGLLNLSAFGGAILATSPLAILSAQWGWRLPLAIVGACALFLGAVNWLVVRDTPQELDFDLAPVVGPLPASDPSNVKSLDERFVPLVREALRVWLSVSAVWRVSLILFLTYGSFQAFQALWAGPYLTDVYDATPVTAGSYLLLIAVGGAVGPTLSGYLSDRWRMRKPFLVVGTVGVTLAWALIFATTSGASDPALYLSFFLLGFTAGFIIIGQTTVKESVPVFIFGTVFGLVNMSPFLGNVGFQFLFGQLLERGGYTLEQGIPVYDATGYALAFGFAMVANVFAIVLALRVPETLRRREDSLASRHP
jgi:sugar phosphate permease